MSSDPSYALQQAVFAALTASTDLIAIFGGTPRVYDTVPVNNAGHVTAQFPYLTIGDDHIIGETDQCNDASLAHVMVEAWSRGSGFPEAKQLAGAIRKALDAPLTLTGHRIVTHTFESLLMRREPDGLTRRAICMLRYHTEPST